MGFLDRFRSGGTGPQGILDSVLLVPTPGTGAAQGERVLEEGEQIAFVLVSDDDGLSVLPAFTSEEALSRWTTEESAYVGLQGRVLIEFLADSDWDRMVIDGADPTALVITRSAAQELLGVTTLSVPAGSTMLVGEPATAPPDGLKDELARACEREPIVRAAYLFQMAIVERDEPPHLAVGLQLDRPVDEAETARIAQAIGDAVEPRRWGYDVVDFHVLSDETLDTASSDTRAVYRRADAAAQ